VISRNAAAGAEVTHFKITASPTARSTRTTGDADRQRHLHHLCGRQRRAEVHACGEFQRQAAASRFRPRPPTLMPAGRQHGQCHDHGQPSGRHAFGDQRHHNEDTAEHQRLVISRMRRDGAEVTHFKDHGITHGTALQERRGERRSPTAPSSPLRGASRAEVTPGRIQRRGSFTIQASTPTLMPAWAAARSMPDNGQCRQRRAGDGQQRHHDAPPQSRRRYQ